MVDAQTVSIVFAGLSIGIAAIYYTLTLRNSQRAQQLQLETRQVQLFAQINDMTTTPQYLDNLREVLSWTWDDFDDFWEKYGMENPDNLIKLASVMIPLNHLGILLNEGLIDPMLLWHWRGPMPLFGTSSSRFYSSGGNASRVPPKEDCMSSSRTSTSP